MLQKTKSKRKPKTKSLGKLKKELWDLVSLYVRQYYADDGGYCRCYTCGNVLPWRQMQAGHGIPGRSNAVLYDLDILKPQDIACNIFGGGKHHIFATKLIEANGMEWWQAKLEGSKRIVKYSRADILGLIDTYKSRLAAL